MSTMKEILKSFKKELKTTYQAQKNIMDVTDKYLTQLENAEAGGGSTVSVTQIQSTGTKIATVTVDGTPTDLYSPKASVTQTVASGTEIAEVDGTKIYIPDAGSVSVAGDGTKTWSQLLDELFALIDSSKITTKSTFEYNAVGTLNTIYHILEVGESPKAYSFTRNDVNSSALQIGKVTIKASGSVYEAGVSAVGGATTYTNASAIAVGSGRVLKIVY